MHRHGEAAVRFDESVMYMTSSEQLRQVSGGLAPTVPARMI